MGSWMFFLYCISSIIVAGRYWAPNIWWINKLIIWSSTCKRQFHCCLPQPAHPPSSFSSLSVYSSTQKSKPESLKSYPPPRPWHVQVVTSPISSTSWHLFCPFLPVNSWTYLSNLRPPTSLWTDLIIFWLVSFFQSSTPINIPNY